MDMETLVALDRASAKLLEAVSLHKAVGEALEYATRAAEDLKLPSPAPDGFEWSARRGAGCHLRGVQEHLPAEGLKRSPVDALVLIDSLLHALPCLEFAPEYELARAAVKQLVQEVDLILAAQEGFLSARKEVFRQALQAVAGVRLNP